MRPAYGNLVLLVSISYVYGFPKWGASKKPQLYRPSFCLTKPFSRDCVPLASYWYYDSTAKTCMPITPGYCSKSFNTFVSSKKCMEMCDPRAKAKLQNCLKPPIVAPCVAAQYAWYYDEFTKSCKMFAYSTCRSNGNYFASEMKCQSVCLPKMTPSPICSADPIPDVCVLRRKHFFFSFKNNTCMPFSRKGCGKGANSFSTLKKCMDTCSYNQSTMAGLNTDKEPENQLPPMKKPAVQNPAGPVSPLAPMGPTMPLTPPVSQGTQTPVVSVGKPGSPGNQVSPSPSINSGPPALPVMPVSPSSPTPQRNPNSHFQTGTPVLPTNPISNGNPVSTSPVFPRGQPGSSLTVPSASTIQTPQLTTPPIFGQPTHLNRSSSAVRPFSTTKPSLTRRAASPLRPGFHKK